MMIVVLIGIFINNVRLTDVTENLRAEIRAVGTRVGSLREVLQAEMEKNHSEMLHRFDALDTRLTTIESGLGMNRG